jgi:hypothetical protein
LWKLGSALANVVWHDGAEAGVVDGVKQRREEEEEIVVAVVGVWIVSSK